MTSAAPPHHGPPASDQNAHLPQSQPPPHSPPPMSPPSKRDLKSWWKGFKLPTKHHDTTDSRTEGIFGVPLRQSITYANVAISLVDEEGKSYIYGYVPIVVAKCGVFLKERATGVEGIFRLNGSEKRIKELKAVFNSPYHYGKGLVWDGYTVHDAANVLRRYLNDLPEPVVPLDLYEKFREPLRGATKQPVADGEGPVFVENFDMDAAITRYQRLITELPPLNRQLLLYILDLLAVFAAKSDENRMNSQNLAAIFQPGMLSHPNHAMAPEEYRLNQSVIIFLIENQDHFLIGMQGTAADENTVREVQKGTPVTNPPVTPIQERTAGVARSSSSASAGAESVAKEGKIRRNKSTSSRRSRHSSGAHSPNTGSPALTTTPTGGLGRSNTVPSKRSPALQTSRFQARADHQPTVSPLTPVNPSAATRAPHPAVVREIMTPSEELPPPAVAPAVAPALAANTAQSSLLGPNSVETTTPQKDRTLQSIFQRSPTGEGEKRAPNKLRKKRLPGSTNPSAQSSTASLPPSAAASPSTEGPNPLESIPSSSVMASSDTNGRQAVIEEQPEPSPTSVPDPPPTSSALQMPRPAQEPQLTNNAAHPEAAENALKPKISPQASLHSSYNDGSDFDQVDEMAPIAEEPEKERKKRWRLSRKKEEMIPPPNPAGASPRQDLGQHETAEASATSFGSSINKPRQSFTAESPPDSAPGSSSTEAAAAAAAAVPGASPPPPWEMTSRDGRDESKGLTGWIKNKYREAKENHEHRRNKSPPPAGAAAAAAQPQPFEVVVGGNQAEEDAANTGAAAAAPKETQ